MVGKAYQRDQVVSDTGPFSIIPEWVIVAEVSHGAVRLYALISRYADYATGEAFPSRATLGSRLRVSTDTVDRFIKELVGIGALTVIRRRDGVVWQSNLYIVRRTQESPQGSRTLAGTGLTGTTTPTRTDAPTPTRTDAELTRTNKQDPIEQEFFVSDVRLVYNEWIECSGRQAKRTKLDDKRRERIEWALDNYSLHDVLDAVRGWQRSPWHCGHNESNKIYNDLTLLLRDCERLEYFRDCFRNPTSATTSTLRLLREKANKKQ